MPATYTLISSNVLTSTQTSVTFSSIPSTYTDLVLRCAVRDTLNIGIGYLPITFNSNISPLYSDTVLRGSGTTASSYRDTSINAGSLEGADIGSGETANTFSSFEVYIPSYTVNQNKPFSNSGVADINSATGNSINASALLFRSTTAISSLTISGGSFATNSSFYLYGISNA